MTNGQTAMERFALSMLVLVLFLLLGWGMWRGWQRKARQQSEQYAPFPPVPEQLDHALARATSTGIYVATTSAGHWQDRIVAGGMGMRGRATLRRYSAGVVVDRMSAPSFFIPTESLVGANTATGMAGKVMGVEGLLVITWQLGEQLVDTGFRADDKSSHQHWIHAILATAPRAGEEPLQQQSIERRADNREH